MQGVSIYEPPCDTASNILQLCNKTLLLISYTLLLFNPILDLFNNNLLLHALFCLPEYVTLYTFRNFLHMKLYILI